MTVLEQQKGNLVYSQEADCENGTHGNLLFPRKAELPEQNHGHSTCDKVLDDTDDGCSSHVGRFIEAVIFAHVVGVPNNVDLPPKRVERSTTNEEIDDEDDEVGEDECDCGVDRVTKACRDGAFC